jgi:hypothetical protein
VAVDATRSASQALLATHNPLCPAFIMASRFRCPCGLAPEEQFAKPRAFDRPNEENALLAFCAMNPQFRTMVHRFVRRIPIEYGLIACEDAGSFDDCKPGTAK